MTTPEVSWRYPFYIALLLCATASAAPRQRSAQQPSYDRPYTWRRTVRRVVEDVVVTDAQGHPVSGLRERDFSIDEDGRSQTILSFESHAMDAAEPVMAPQGLPAGTLIDLPAVPERGPLYVLVYDMVHIPSLDKQMFARQQLIKFVRTAPEGVRFAIFAISDGIHLVQGFTNNRNLLLAALDPEGNTPHMPKAFLYAGNYLRANPQAGVLIEIAGYLQGMPGRKNVIWIADGIDIPLFASAGSPDQQRAAIDLLNSLAAARISVYPIDAAGVAGGITKMTEYQVEDKVAEETGGRAYYSTNDLVDALDKATQAGSIYYTLSYDPGNAADASQFRRIEVRLAKKGYQLFYRPRYFADPDDTAGDASSTVSPTPASGSTGSGVPDDLYFRIRHGMPMDHDVVFLAAPHPVGRARLATDLEMGGLAANPAYFRTRSKGKTNLPQPPVPLQEYEIDYSIPARQFRLQPGMKHAAQDTLEFAAAAYDRDGHLLNGIITHATSTRRGETASYRAIQAFDVPVPAAWLSLAVRDVDTGRIGNLEIALPSLLPGR